MKSFIVHLSDPVGVDEQAIVVVQDEASLGKAVHLAIDEIVERCGNSLSFPLFVDIHPAHSYQQKAWMYPVEQERERSHVPDAKPVFS